MSFLCGMCCCPLSARSRCRYGDRTPGLVLPHRMLPLLCVLCAPRDRRKGHRRPGACISPPLSKLLQQRRRYHLFGPVLTIAMWVCLPTLQPGGILSAGDCVSGHLRVIFVFSLLSKTVWSYLEFTLIISCSSPCMSLTGMSFAGMS